MTEEVIETIEKYKKEGYEGCDASLEISLFEYGIIWKRDVDGDNDWLFIYNINEEEERYDCGWIDKIDELDNLDFNEVARFCGMTKEEWLKTELPRQVYDMFIYYGYENVFGSTYHGGFKIKENGDL